MRKIHRRSFLLSVAGAAALGGGYVGGGRAAASVLPPHRGLCSDTDKGANADRAYAWIADRDREPSTDPIRRAEPEALSDRDAGPNADPPAPRIGFCGYKRRER